MKQGEIDQIERGLMEIKQKSDKYDKLGKPTDYKHQRCVMDIQYQQLE